MSTSPSERIVAAATAWPGVTTAHGSRGELSIRAGKREIGHLHGDHAAHFGFPKDVSRVLRAQGRVAESNTLVAPQNAAARNANGLIAQSNGLVDQYNGLVDEINGISQQLGGLQGALRPFG